MVGDTVAEPSNLEGRLGTIGGETVELDLLESNSESTPESAIRRRSASLP
jgi:hypothetical protein